MNRSTTAVAAWGYVVLTTLLEYYIFLNSHIYGFVSNAGVVLSLISSSDVALAAIGLTQAVVAGAYLMGIRYENKVVVGATFVSLFFAALQLLEWISTFAH
jgi:hypothetical protein